MSSEKIWVVAELRKGQVTRSTYQLIAAARDLAQIQGSQIEVLIFGGDEQHVQELIRKAPHVLWLQGENLEPYESTVYVNALSSIINSREMPSIVLLNSSAMGLELTPRLAAKFDAAYAGSCVKLWWEDSTLAVRRPVYGGRIYEELMIQSDLACITVRPGSYPEPDDLSVSGVTEVIKFEELSPKKLTVIDRHETNPGKKELLEADCIVAGGRGLEAAENFSYIEELAHVVDGAVGCTRGVVDAGWRPHDEQVGKSGKTVSPELYFACGISGAIHHILGMNTSKCVVAINKDPEAPIFAQADYGIVGDALEILPEITRQLKSFSSDAC